MCYTSLALSASTIGVAAVKKADVAYVVQGPATIGLPASILRLLRGIPFVYDIKDLWPDTLLSTGMFHSRAGYKIVDAWCKFIYKQAGKIVVITPGVKKKLCQRGVPEDKVEMIYEWCDDSQIQSVGENPALADELGLAGRFNILFAGNMGLAQSLSAVLDAAKLLASDHPHVQFVFIGGGVEVDSLKQKADNMGLRNVRFFPRRPVSEIGAILRLADVLLVHLRDDPFFETAIPSKTQAYMAAGRPILMCVKGDAADLVKKASAGLTCEPENPQSIAEAVRKLITMPKAELEQMGSNGKRFYDQELNFEIGFRKYENILENVAKSYKR
jgi:colanic acid biosynthesis glycosyl transferase WcaI